MSICKFMRDISTSRLVTHPPTNLSDRVDYYNTTLPSLLDKHASLKTKTIRSVINKSSSVCSTLIRYLICNTTS